MINDLFEALKKKIKTDRRFDLDQYGQDFVKRRINARLMSLKITQNDWGAYFKVLESDPEEYVKLFDCFSVNVTEFFRDISAWKALREKYLPAFLEGKRKKNSKTLKIWSAACSSGEEPYSIAMMLKGFVPGDIQISITASDIDSDALSKAKKGVYAADQLKNVEGFHSGFMEKYFKLLPKESSGPSNAFEKDRYQISDQIKNMVLFIKHDFLADTPLQDMDIIFCRNVMIYIAQKSKQALISVFNKALAPDGLLVIGKTEVLFTNEFTSLDLKEHIYCKNQINVEGQS